MPVNTKIYDDRFFKNTLKLEAASSRSFVGVLTKFFNPQSVIDVGCGNGVYLAEFAKNNVAILGYDGSPAALAGSLVGDKIKLHDLCEPLKLNRGFDLCLCLEVAEHLPENCAATLVNTLCRLADTIIFTAATPGQGPKSIGHINEQPREYWKKLFAEKNYSLNEKLTGRIGAEIAEAQVVWWLTKNLMIYEKTS